MTTTTITSKGQIVIPSRIRKHLNIKSGMRFVVQEQGNKIVIEQVDQHYFDQFAGILEGTNATEDLLKERKREKERENKKWSKS
ncbi:MAG: AbrB/MazE/SpoVT family DNA-binding domain-containing protein [Candidatus Omnitrophota bacterium]